MDTIDRLIAQAAEIGCDYCPRCDAAYAYSEDHLPNCPRHDDTAGLRDDMLRGLADEAMI